jgi:hypothetical protein
MCWLYRPQSCSLGRLQARVVAAFSALEKPGGLGASGDLTLHLIQIVGVLGGMGSLFAIFAAIVSWTDKEQRLWYRIWSVNAK